QAVKDGHAEERDEAPRGDAEGHAAQEQREDAAHHSEGDTGEHQQCLPDRIEGSKKQREDEKERKWNNDEEPRAGALQVLELPTELWPVSRRKRDYPIIEDPSQIFDEAADVATAHVPLDDDEARAVLV